MELKRLKNLLKDVYGERIAVYGTTSINIPIKLDIQKQKHIADLVVLVNKRIDEVIIWNLKHRIDN